MRKALSALALLWFVSVPSAHAAGVGMRWNHCFSENTGVMNRSFACDTNAGTELLVGTFLPSTALSQVVQIDAIVDLAAASPVLPAWWQLAGVGACRAGALSANIEFDPANLNCLDWSDGVAPAAAMNYQPGVRGANTARILVSATMNAADTPAIFAWNEYFAFNLPITHVATTGLCGGCSAPVCIMLTSITLTRANNPTPLVMSGAENGTDANYVTWQGGGAPTVGSATGCPAATPTRNTSWSAVKSMYR